DRNMTNSHPHSYGVVYVALERTGKPTICALWRKEPSIGYDAHITSNQPRRVLADKLTERIATHDGAQTPYWSASSRSHAAYQRRSDGRRSRSLDGYIGAGADGRGGWLRFALAGRPFHLSLPWSGRVRTMGGVHHPGGARGGDEARPDRAAGGRHEFP